MEEFGIKKEAENIILFKGDEKICNIEDIDGIADIPESVKKWSRGINTSIALANSIKNDSFIAETVKKINSLSPPNKVNGGVQSAFIGAYGATLAYGREIEKKMSAVKSIFPEILRTPDITAYGRWGYDGGWASKVWIVEREANTYFLYDKEGNGNIGISTDLSEAIVQYATVIKYKALSDIGAIALQKADLREVE
jgi:hypothetical protein